MFWISRSVSSRSAVPLADVRVASAGVQTDRRRIHRRDAEADVLEAGFSRPRLDRIHERAADPRPACLGRDPHPVHGRRVRAIGSWAADRPCRPGDRIGRDEHGTVGRVRVLLPFRIGPGRGPGERRAEGVGIGRKGAQAKVAQGLPLVGADTADLHRVECRCPLTPVAQGSRRRRAIECDTPPRDRLTL